MRCEAACPGWGGGGGYSPIKVMGVLIIPFSGLNLWNCGLNLGLRFSLHPLMVDSLHLPYFSFIIFNMLYFSTYQSNRLNKGLFQ